MPEHPVIEIVIRSPQRAGKSALARLVRAAILDDVGLFVDEHPPADLYQGCELRGEDVSILRRLWPHVRIVTEDAP